VLGLPRSPWNSKAKEHSNTRTRTPRQRCPEANRLGMKVLHSCADHDVGELPRNHSLECLNRHGKLLVSEGERESPNELSLTTFKNKGMVANRLYVLFLDKSISS